MTFAPAPAPTSASIPASLAPHSRFDEVDALRSLAMIAVIAQHADLLPLGWIGVWIFYVISGFVVATSVLGGADKGLSAGRRVSLFYIRRIARIVPSYYAYALLALVLSVALGQPLLWAERLSQFTFTYNFFLVANDVHPLVPTTHLWTISAEMQFYAVVGIVLVACSRATLQRLFTALLFVCLAGRLAVLPWVDNFDVMTHLSFLHFDAFSAGCLLALHRDRITAARANALLLAGLVAMALFVAAYALVNHAQGAHGFAVFAKILSGNAVGQGRQALMFTPIILLGAGLVSSAFTPGSWVLPLLSPAWLIRIGRASYSGYLIHFAVVKSLRELAARWLGIDWASLTHRTGLVDCTALFVASTLVTVLLADLCHRGFEVPASRFVRPRLERWLPARAQVPA